MQPNVENKVINNTYINTIEEDEEIGITYSKRQ